MSTRAPATPQTDDARLDQPGPGSLPNLRNTNRDRIVALLADGTSLSQADLSRSTGLSSAAVSGIVQELAASGVVTVRATVTNGRRGHAVELAAAHVRYGLGVDIGRTHMTVALARNAGEALTEATVPFRPDEPLSATIATVGQLTDDACTSLGIERTQVRSGVVGVAAGVDARHGRLLGRFPFLDWRDKAVAEEFSASLEIPVALENDANLGAVAHMNLVDTTDGLVFVHIGSGVGSGIVIDGRLVRGATTTGGSIGHASVDRRFGAVCWCGHRGCLETVASLPSLRHAISVATGDDVDARDLTALVGRHDPAALAAVHTAAEALAAVLAPLCMTLCPAHVVLGGPAAAFGDALLQPVQTAFEAGVLPGVAGATTIAISPLGARSTLLGALTMAVRTTTTAR